MKSLHFTFITLPMLLASTTAGAHCLAPPEPSAFTSTTRHPVHCYNGDNDDYANSADSVKKDQTEKDDDSQDKD